mgnify:CR=1 FL=1|tara:strand:+ start:56 stop:508 length:453 start_codon:yes stop_codon:yes gene_type:complete
MEDSCLDIYALSNYSCLMLPLAIETVSAGFPSPAEEYIDIGIDLNRELIKHPTSTFLLRVSGHSMTNVGIHNGDLLIVDRSIDAQPGKIVIAILDGCFTVKKLTYANEKLYLEASSPNYPPIDISRYESIQIWGVAIYCIHNLNHISKSL